MTRLFPRNFVRIQEPPILRVLERRDGAITVEPPQIGGEGQTFKTTQTATGSISKSGTDTAQGTSTNTSTGSQTGALVRLEEGDAVRFQVLREFVTSCTPTGFVGRVPGQAERFELAGTVPKGRFDSPEDGDVRLTGDLKLTQVDVVGDVVRPPAPIGEGPFVLPDLSRPGHRPAPETGAASDDDNDDDGDEDNDPDSDNDNDSDDEPDHDDRPDFLGAADVEIFQKAVKVRAPLSEGTHGTIDPDR